MYVVGPKTDLVSPPIAGIFGGKKFSIARQIVLISLVATIDKTIAMLESQYNTPDETDELFAVASQVDPTADSSPHWHGFTGRWCNSPKLQWNCRPKASVFLESLLCAAPTSCVAAPAPTLPQVHQHRF